MFVEVFIEISNYILKSKFIIVNIKYPNMYEALCIFFDLIVNNSFCGPDSRYHMETVYINKFILVL